VVIRLRRPPVLRAIPALLWLRRRQTGIAKRIPGICRGKEAKSTLFDQIADETFAKPPPG
jgi:hypothetical protein